MRYLHISLVCVNMNFNFNFGLGRVNHSLHSIQFEIFFPSRGTCCLTQRVYRYITKVKNMPNHQLSHMAWNVGCKLQKNHKSKFLSSSWVVDIRKWFRRWGMDDLLELLGDTMQYVMIEERLMESLRMSGKMLRGQS